MKRIEYFSYLYLKIINNKILLSEKINKKKITIILNIKKNY